MCIHKIISSEKEIYEYMNTLNILYSQILTSGVDCKECISLKNDRKITGSVTSTNRLTVLLKGTHA